jgi:hypothetical protein
MSDVQCVSCFSREVCRRDAESDLLHNVRPYADAGKIRVLYHLVDLIDRNLGGTGSLRAGNAGAFAQDAGSGRFASNRDVLFAEQPDESDDAFRSNAKLISLARHARSRKGHASP